jgi:hypothetical protein
MLLVRWEKPSIRLRLKLLLLQRFQRREVVVREVKALEGLRKGGIEYGNEKRSKKKNGSTSIQKEEQT